MSFEGRGYIQYLKDGDTKRKASVKRNEMRKHRKNKVDNPRENTRV